MQRIAVAVKAARGVRTQEQIVALADGGLSKPVLSLIENAHQPSYKPRTIAALRQAFGWTENQFAAMLNGEAPSQPAEVDQLTEIRRQLADYGERLERLETARAGAATPEQFAVAADADGKRASKSAGKRVNRPQPIVEAEGP